MLIGKVMSVRGFTTPVMIQSIIATAMVRVGKSDAAVMKKKSEVFMLMLRGRERFTRFIRSKLQRMDLVYIALRRPDYFAGEAKSAAS